MTNHGVLDQFAKVRIHGNLLGICKRKREKWKNCEGLQSAFSQTNPRNRSLKETMLHVTSTFPAKRLFKSSHIFPVPWHFVKSSFHRHSFACKTRYDTKPRAPGLTLENSLKVIRKWSIALSSTQISMWLVPYDQIGVQFSRLLYTSLCRERAAKNCFSR